MKTFSISISDEPTVALRTLGRPGISGQISIGRHDLLWIVGILGSDYIIYSIRTEDLVLLDRFFFEEVALGKHKDVFINWRKDE